MSGSNGPLTAKQWESLRELAKELTAEQSNWAQGFLAGFQEARQTPHQATPTQPQQPQPQAAQVAVLFGSQTGNAEGIACQLHERLRQAGIPARLESMAAYKTAQLKREEALLLVVSTHGEGEPPDNARGFHEFLRGKKVPRLESLRFAVLALGDASYEQFCQTGKDFDQRLEELGAKRIQDRVDCDVDYENDAEQWIAGIPARLAQTGIPQTAPSLALSAPAIPPAYSKKQPFPAPVLENLSLTGRGSSKEVRHIELSVEGSGLVHQPGDSLGVLPLNWPERVADVIAQLRLDPRQAVNDADGAGTTLEAALLEDYEITSLTRPFLEKYAQLAQSNELSALLQEDRRVELRDFVHGREIIDVLRRYPVPGLAAEQFLKLLRKLPPRSYSIASSPLAHPGEIHLTVGVVRYESHGLKRQGVASTYLADRLGEDGRVLVYVDSNPNFRLPENPDTPIIMVGPGTGVAPFRAFVAEREAAGAKGKNWLFFGDRTFHDDFVYQAEWLDYRARGVLDRIDVAFSRDGADKVYVQHRLRERAREVYAWLEEGAHFYVCGDAQHMAADVQEALIAAVAQAGGLSREHAEAYVEALQSSRRYQRDVY